MATRLFQRPWVRGQVWVFDEVQVFPQGTNPPLLAAGQGDAGYWTVARTGVGTYTVTTVDPYPYVKGKGAQITMATPANWSVIFGAPVKNANNTWTFPFTTFNAGVAADLAANANNIVELSFTFRNSGALP